MRSAVEFRRPPGSLSIEQIRLDAKSRDDIPPLPGGLQATQADKVPRTELFRLPDEHILSGRRRETGRPGHGFSRRKSFPASERARRQSMSRSDLSSSSDPFARYPRFH